MLGSHSHGYGFTCRVDIDTGACVLDTENDGTVILWYTDAKFVIRYCDRH